MRAELSLRQSAYVFVYYGCLVVVFVFVVVFPLFIVKVTKKKQRRGQVNHLYQLNENTPAQNVKKSRINLLLLRIRAARY